MSKTPKPKSASLKADQLRAFREAKADETEKRKRGAPGSFDRKAYQRELMRKRRAAGKAK